MDVSAASIDRHSVGTRKITNSSRSPQIGNDQRSVNVIRWMSLTSHISRRTPNVFDLHCHDGIEADIPTHRIATSMARRIRDEMANQKSQQICADGNVPVRVVQIRPEVCQTQHPLRPPLRCPSASPRRPTRGLEIASTNTRVHPDHADRIPRFA